MLVALVVTLAAFGLAVYGLLDVVFCAGRAPRRMPSWGWFLVVMLVPFAGPVAWLVMGRPALPRHLRSVLDAVDETVAASPGPAGQWNGFRGPEDDPAFLERLRRERG